MQNLEETIYIKLLRLYEKLLNPLLHAITNNGIRFFPFGIAKKMYQVR